MEIQDPLPGIVDASQDPEKVMNRDTPTPDEARRAAVTKWQSCLTEARKYWTDKAFTRMIEDQRFVAGRQWPANDPTKDRKSTRLNSSH